MTKLTKAQLEARIAECEAACGLKDITIAELTREVEGLMYAQRPSRNGDTVNVTPPIVVVQGRRCYKTVAWEGGRKVTTYKPVAAH